MEFSPEDLALATIPGMTFDPRERAFSVDELRPQPIVRKRKKVKEELLASYQKQEPHWQTHVCLIAGLRSFQFQRWEVLGEARQEQHRRTKVSWSEASKGESGH